ncbi:hypothetical protein [uncultured Arcticibacterium sp.]|uniref:hypothetical protein n=1 Tax=uncultured Arcticibacterium sp. TaxID=2173042 RepID=UPI0030F91A8D
MKLKLLTLFMFTGLVATAQLVGTEQVVIKQLYTGDFTVNGDKDTYYLVIV